MFTSEAHAAASVPRTLRVSSESDVGKGVPAAPQPEGWRTASALCSTSNAHVRASVAVSPPDKHGARATAPVVAPPAASPPVSDAAAKWVHLAVTRWPTGGWVGCRVRSGGAARRGGGGQPSPAITGLAVPGVCTQMV